ncbi:MAG: hypothetical protein A2Y37_05155 [Spirochaetes bacterium GWB1_60_80]|nr:MAG: Bacterial transcription activator, effector binding domain protein [candidate division Kazan bacterium GW2011_GWC1_52_13]OHD16330.1 MAG: hypothetical protein A2Y37_05155 [Spirochaetes bacterium GWB1_60_80]OHD60247.1 MAG: hypothetical protein A2Y32_07395 [Spirochaetes bacterium GWF1_60_12]HAX37599.1 hypothetical protein [Spirochaetaceae bacterium]HBO40981.1 hypothetical protein [Spirochaetaceae bacterium]
MLTMGEFSATTRLTVKTLRLYHDEGILVPERIDPSSGYRYYGDGSWQRAQSIILLRELGFSHKELKDILAECQEDHDLPKFLAQRMGIVKQELAQLIERHSRLALYLATLSSPVDSAAASGRNDGGAKRGDNGVYEKQLPELLIASIRFKGSYDQIGGHFAALFKAAGRYACGAPLALYHNSEYREEDADIEAAIPIRKEISFPQGSCRRIGPGAALCTQHRGPYDSLGGSYRILFELLHARDLLPLVPSREVYLKGPGLIFLRDPKRFVTEIQIPYHSAAERPE